MADDQPSEMDIDDSESTTLPSASTSSSTSTNELPPKLPRLRVLSLFDGIGTGYYSLKELGFDIEVFYASEIDKDALMLTKYHFSNNIIQLGDVTEITTAMLDQIGPINLLIGGSPCADLSGVNFRKKGLYNPDGSGILFFDYYRIWNYLNLKSTRGNTPFYWLFENVASMENKNEQAITKSQPPTTKEIFWTNLLGLNELSKAQEINHFVVKEPKLEDYLEKNLDRQANVEKIGTITSKRSCLQDGKSRNPVSQDGEYTGLYITEIEAIFGLPPHFTDVGDLSIPSRQKVLGRAWSVQVIKQLLNLLTGRFSKK